MRNKSEFKAYVYEKADVQAKIYKKRNAAFARTAVALSLCLVVTGAWIYADGFDKYAATADAGVEVAMAPISPESVVENEAEVACDFARGTGDDSDTVQDYKYKSEITQETVTVYGASSAALYSVTLDTAIAETQLPYTVAETADAYVGERTDIDFDTHFALVFSDMHILSHLVAYGDDVITVTLKTGDGKADPYTVPIERARFADQQIRVVFP